MVQSHAQMLVKSKWISLAFILRANHVRDILLHQSLISVYPLYNVCLLNWVLLLYTTDLVIIIGVLFVTKRKFMKMKIYTILNIYKGRRAPIKRAMNIW